MTEGWSFRSNGVGELVQGGVSRLLLGGQVHNSSSSSTRAFSEAIAHVRRVNGNTVIAPVSWAQFEPEEGRFDFALVDHLLAEVRAHELRLVLLWFGAFKNAASTYAPRWVRADRARFPRAQAESRSVPAFSYEGATAKPVLSVFSGALSDASAAAVEALARRIGDLDAQDLVALIQIENEVGILSDSRDRSVAAEAAWRAPVPTALLDALREARGAESMARTVWREQGERSGGAWAEIFGNDWRADEVFMAWAFASHAESIAQRVRQVIGTPLYANAWLGPQPAQDRAGEYPSGGPTSRVLDVWRAAAPTLSMLSPDIYVEDTDPVMRDYAAGGALFVPECRISAAELVRAVGVHKAVGWSAFGIDDVREDGQVAATLGFLTALEPLIAHARATGGLAAAVVEGPDDVVRCQIGDIGISIRGSLAQLRRMLLDAGVQAPVTDPELPDETAPYAHIPAGAERRPFVLIVREAHDSVIAVGQGVTLDFDGVDGIEIDAVEELLVDERVVVAGRVLNGDERLRLLPVETVGAARIRLLVDGGAAR